VFSFKKPKSLPLFFSNLSFFLVVARSLSPTVVEPESHRGGTGVSPWWDWSFTVVAQKHTIFFLQKFAFIQKYVYLCGRINAFDMPREVINQCEHY